MRYADARQVTLGARVQTVLGDVGEVLDAQDTGVSVLFRVWCEDAGGVAGRALDVHSAKCWPVAGSPAAAAPAEHAGAA